MEELQKTIAKAKEDLASVKRKPKIVGDWIFEDEGKPQFRSEVSVEKGKFILEADMPSDLGGWGSKPGPLHFCIFGLASCYATTFAMIAAMEGIKLTKLKIEAESHVDFSKTFGLTDNPIVEEARWKLIVGPELSEEKVQYLEKLAEERCPAVFCLTNPVKLTIDVQRE